MTAPTMTTEEASTSSSASAAPSTPAPSPPQRTKGGPKKASEERPRLSDQHLKSILESLVFVSDRPVPAKRLARIARARLAEVRKMLEELTEEYAGRGIELVELGGGYQFRSAAANAPFVRSIIARRPVRLTRAQLETLAISAYRQPLTRPELEEIRGVDSASALKVLLERGMLKILGRKDEPGRPLIYGTTPAFLELFGMKSLEDLPTLKEFSELTDESKALFARKTGEDIDSIGDIEIPDGAWNEPTEADEDDFLDAESDASDDE